MPQYAEILLVGLWYVQLGAGGRFYEIILELPAELIVGGSAKTSFAWDRGRGRLSGIWLECENDELYERPKK